MDLLLKQSKQRLRALVSSKVSAPGSLMLFGEHAVLQGRHAIACAIDRRVTVSITPRIDTTIRIFSSLGVHTTTTELVTQDSKLSFVTQSICACKEELLSGFDLHIDSELSHTTGLGSSGAITVATTAALQCALGKEHNPFTLFDQAVEVVRKVQGKASGTDVAATIFGGTVCYTLNPLTIELLKKTYPITLLYSGEKLLTSKVIDLVLEKQKNHPDLYEHIFTAMEEVTLCAKQAIIDERWGDVGALANTFHGLMDALGVSDKRLCECAWILRSHPHILGAKISGSGLGDSVLGFGETTTLSSCYEQISARMSLNGVLFL